jgi:TPR repeat protein
MRISERILSTALFSVGLGLATAYAFDGTTTPGNVAPGVGIEVVPRASAPGYTTQSLAPNLAAPGGVAPRMAAPVAVGPGVGAAALVAPGLGALGTPDLHTPLSSFQAFQSGAKALRDGDTKAGLSALEYAATNGHLIAAWKLGRMYADGDGVKQNNLRAFEYFRSIADGHADESADTTQAPFVANAFVALGIYYLDGIPNSDVKPDADRAREMFSYAAIYFGDRDAQYNLGRLYLDGNGGFKDPKQAVRWLLVAARKGQYQAQAVLGSMLFKGDYVPRQGPRGLMWLTLARDAATPRESWITDLYAAAVKQASEDERAIAMVYLERWLKTHRD